MKSWCSARSQRGMVRGPRNRPWCGVNSGSPLAILLVLVCGLLSCEGADYKLRTEHPRMLLTEDRLEDVRLKIRAAPVIWKEAIKAAEAPSTGKSSGDRLICAAAIYRVGLVPGFRYGRSREEYGSIAKTELLEWKGPLFGNQDRVDVISPVSLGYDWLHELLTDEERTLVRDRIVAAIQRNDTNKIDMAWVGYNQWHGNGMIGALAVHGETRVDHVELYRSENWFKVKHDDAMNYRLAAEWFPKGGHPEGFWYVSRAWSNFVTKSCWESATSPSDRSLADLGVFTQNTLWELNSVAPLSGRPGGTFRSLPKYNYGGFLARSEGHFIELQCSTGFGGDTAALSRWMMDATHGYERSVRLPGVAVISGLLIGDPRVAGKSPEQLKIPLDFVMEKPGEYVGRSSWDADATVVSFACSWRLDRIKMNGDVMVFSKGKTLTGNRDSIFQHSYGEHWFRNNVLFYSGDELEIVPKHLRGGRVAGSFKQLPKGEFEGDLGNRYGGIKDKDMGTKQVRSVKRTFRYDRESSRVIVRDDVACAGKLIPRICWNTPLAPEVKGHEVILQNPPARAVMRFDPPPQEIRVVGGPDNWDFSRDYAGKPGPEKQYGAFVRMKPDMQVTAGGYYTIFVAMPPGGGAMTTTITVD